MQKTINQEKIVSIASNFVGDIISKNIGSISGKYVLVYDTESTLSNILAEAYKRALPENHTAFDFKTTTDDFKEYLHSLPKDSLVILVQSTNFRIANFRIRLELFHRGIHCIEHNHLGYYPNEQAETYVNTLEYRTPEYVAATKLLQELAKEAETTKILSTNGEILTFGKVEMVRGNTGDYSESEVKGGTYPIGEAFTEAINLSDVQGECRVFGYPNDLFQVVFCEPFTVTIKDGILLDNPNHPADFRMLMERIRSEEDGIAIVRELGIGYNPAISLENRLSDVNGHERHLGVHLSIGRKHGIFAKKFAKDVLQKYHIDIFLEVSHLEIGGVRVDFDKKAILQACN